MYSVFATQCLDGHIAWQVNDQEWDRKPEEGVRLSFNTSNFHSAVQRRDSLRHMERAFAENDVTWATRRGNKWEINLDQFAEFIEDLKRYSWFHGTVYIEPEFEPSGKSDHMPDLYEAQLVFYITPDTLITFDNVMAPPPEITESLQRYRVDYPAATSTAFIMMQFGATKAHDAIVTSIRSALEPHGIVAVRADDKDYHDDLFPNILTYIYGCTFGIAVFERLQSDQFNPNVSLEVGYMLAFGKPVCLLKDSTLTTLNTDLIGKLYKPFDPQEPKRSIPSQLTKWCEDRQLIPGS